MIDLDVLCRQVEWANQKRRNNFTLSIDEAAELITRLRQAEKDAARYRWLRDEADDGANDLLMSVIARDEWDECIDESL